MRLRDHRHWRLISCRLQSPLCCIQGWREKFRLLCLNNGNDCPLQRRLRSSSQSRQHRRYMSWTSPSQPGPQLSKRRQLLDRLRGECCTSQTRSWYQLMTLSPGYLVHPVRYSVHRVSQDLIFNWMRVLVGRNVPRHSTFQVRSIHSVRQFLGATWGVLPEAQAGVASLNSLVYCDPFTPQS